MSYIHYSSPDVTFLKSLRTSTFSALKSQTTSSNSEIDRPYPLSYDRRRHKDVKIRRYMGVTKYEKFIASCLDLDPYLPEGIQAKPPKQRLFQRVSNTQFIKNISASVDAQDVSATSLTSQKLIPMPKKTIRYLVKTQAPTPPPPPQDESTSFQKSMCSECDNPYEFEKRKRPHHFANIVYGNIPRKSKLKPTIERSGDKTKGLLEADFTLAVASRSKRVIQKIGKRRSSTELYKHIVIL